MVCFWFGAIGGQCAQILGLLGAFWGSFLVVWLWGIAMAPCGTGCARSVGCHEFWCIKLTAAWPSQSLGLESEGVCEVTLIVGSTRNLHTCLVLDINVFHCIFVMDLINVIFQLKWDTL